MNSVREYRTPLIIGAGALVVALILWAVLVSPQASKLSSLHSKEAQLQGQEATLQIKLASLKSEKQSLTKSCADLEKIATQIPSVQSPTDIDAEESSFESQFNGLAASSGVSLSQFSGFAPASSTAAAPTTASGPATTQTPAGVVAVPTTLTVTGSYGQMSSFIKGLDSFPRLFIIQTFNLSYGIVSPSATGSSDAAASGSSAATAASSGTSAAASASTPLWVGGSSSAPSSGPYSLSIEGSIYYTTTPNALSACTKATTSIH
jgi:Tfp pilus assembly protein PilO